MKCPYCKEEIITGARKCKICGEFLGVSSRLKRFTGLIGGVLSLIISIGSLGLAYLELQGRIKAENDKKIAIEEKNEAVEQKIKAEEVTEQTMSILNKVPKEVIIDVANSELNRVDNKTKAAYHRMMNDRYSLADTEEQFRNVIEKNPDNEIAKRGLIYSKVLKKKRER